MQHFLSTVLIAVAVLTPDIVIAGTSEVAVRIDGSGAVVVPVSINGSGPFPFLLDTGSTHSVISGTLADYLALRFVAKTSVLTSTGREWRAVVELDQTTIGALRSEQLLASVVPAAQLESITRGVEGIIGQDFLFALHYTLDYQSQRLRWNDATAGNDGTRVPLVARDGRYLVQVLLPGEKTPMLLVPDSGANGFVMYARDGRTRAPLKPLPGLVSALSLSGGHDVRRMMLGELRLGTATLRNQPVAVLDRAAYDAIEGDGLLPLHLFSSVTFNPREGYLSLRGLRGTSAE